MDVLLIIIVTPLILLIGVMFTSKGECYYCGYKFHREESLMFKNGKKWCGCNKGYDEIIKHAVKRAETFDKIKRSK